MRSLEGGEMFAHACKLGLEGVVSKVRDSVYASDRGNHWVKKTCAQRETLTIAGYAIDKGKWDGIYVGRRKGADLIYAGKVDHGFDKASATALQERLKPLIRKTQPCAKRIAHKGIWVEPKLLAEIEYRAKSAEGKVPPSLLQGTSGGSVMDAFDRFWQWATKPLESQLTIPAELHRAVMELAPEARRDRAAVNQAAASVLDPGTMNA
jgi:ATP-dependent DNA ligase